ncbi:MAG TPA: hypothetical protein VFO85_11240, partial [Vicinamibacteria bacterium]|nr:hypothetical protein [Vicinamibacteria bacterium]
LALAGWWAAPPLIERFFPSYVASIPAVRWSLLAGLVWSLAPIAQVLGSLKAWRSLAVFVAVAFAARWVFPWWLSQGEAPLEGVARGNLVAAVVAGLTSLVLVQRATAARPAEGT